MTIEYKHIEVRTGTAGEWAAANPVLEDGEAGWARNVGLKIGNGVDPWLALPYFVLAPALAAYVLKSGDTMSGALTLIAPPANDMRVQVDSPNARESQIRLSTGGLLRWQFRKSDSESGVGNNGGNLYWDRFNDAGGYLGTVATFNRATGVVGFGGEITHATPAAADNSIRSATTQWVRDFATANPTGSPVSIARQTLLPTTDTYLGGKAIVAAELTASSHFRFVLAISKTAATGNPTINLRYGAAGSTADPLVTSLTLTGTAAADTGLVTIEVGVDSISATTGSMTASIHATHNGNTTGLSTVPAPAGNAQATTLDTTAARVLGVSISNTVASVVSVLSGTIQKIAA